MSSVGATSRLTGVIVREQTLMSRRKQGVFAILAMASTVGAAQSSATVSAAPDPAPKAIAAENLLSEVKRRNSEASSFGKAVLDNDAAAVRAVLQQNRDAWLEKLRDENGDLEPAIYLAVRLKRHAALREICAVATVEELNSKRVGYPLHQAAELGDTESVRMLTAPGKMTPRLWNGTWGKTPLMHAASAGHPEIVSLLLQKGFDPKSRSADGYTAWLYAKPWERGGAECLQLLRDVTPKAYRRRPDGFSLVHQATAASPAAFEAAVKTLVELEAFSPDARWIGEAGNETPLFLLVKPRVHVPMESLSSRLAKAEILLQHGADVNERDDLGRSALHLASMANDSAFMNLLLRYGAAVDSVASPRFSRGESPIALAVMSRASDAIELLLSRNADVDLRAGPTCSSARDLASGVSRGPADRDSRFSAPNPFPLTPQVETALEKVRTAPAGASETAWK